MTNYHLRTYRIPAALEEDFGAELLERGSLGCEVRPLDGGNLHLAAWFPDPLPAALTKWDPGSWARRGVELVDVEAVPERDWLADYRATARPIAVGRRFLIDPRDADDTSRDGAGEDDPGLLGRELLRIPARAAFGTGSHESTRLAVEWLEELELEDRDVLDVGTGSGILAFAALRLGARRAVGFDVDPAAPLIARANGALNRSWPFFFAGRPAALRAVPAFDVALVNVLPERILGDLPQIVEVLRPAARVVSSGNLWGRRDELARAFADCGLEIRGEKREGDWAAYLLVPHPA